VNEDERQRKIEEIRRTGKTWQWPDPLERPVWTRDHKVMLGWMVLTLACVGWLIWLAVSHL
jgi:hypothetical protein